MFNIAFYLQKYSSIGLKEENIKKFLIDSIKEVCNVDIAKEKIKISSNIINLNLIGPEKTEIFINKEKINKLFISKVEGGGYKTSEKKII